MKKNKLTKDEVLKLIIDECKYQDFHSEFDVEFTVGDYLTMMRAYLNRADEQWLSDESCISTLDTIRKIAATCVTTMQTHGAPKRKRKK